MNNQIVSGCEGHDVREVKKLLAQAGFWPREAGSRAGSYTEVVRQSVQAFQMTAHLKPDGIVGPKTFAALQGWKAAAKPPERLGRPPDGIGLERTTLLQRALQEVGVREQPLGSNRGPDVDRYLPGWARRTPGKGPPWCCFFASWVVSETFGACPWGRVRGSVYATYLAAETAGLIVPEKGLIPGDLFVMLGDGPEDGAIPGHIGFVYWSDGRGNYATIEGNCRNAVRIAERSAKDLVGGIAVSSTKPKSYEKGRLDGAAAAAGLGGTR